MKLLKPSLLVSLLTFSVSAFATHVPDGDEVIVYDPMIGATYSGGQIGWTDPLDGYDWYCFDVVAGNEVRVGAYLEAGDLALNLGVAQGVAGPGGTFGSLTGVASTSNDTITGNVFLDFTPEFTGTVTLYVSTWNEEPGGAYTVAWGGDSYTYGGSPTPGGCVMAPPRPPTSVPALNSLGLLLMIGLFSVLGWVGARRLI